VSASRNSRGRFSSRTIETDRLRYCVTCDRTLPWGSFGGDASKASGFKSICLECDRAKARAYYDRKRRAELAAREEP
jgi:hypothetical protein